jgi:hypothetical protein
MHNLMKENIKDVIPDVGDPLLRIMFMLGSPPEVRVSPGSLFIA